MALHTIVWEVSGLYRYCFLHRRVIVLLSLYVFLYLLYHSLKVHESIHFLISTVIDKCSF